MCCECCEEIWSPEQREEYLEKISEGKTVYKSEIEYLKHLNKLYPKHSFFKWNDNNHYDFDEENKKGLVLYYDIKSQCVLQLEAVGRWGNTNWRMYDYHNRWLQGCSSVFTLNQQYKEICTAFKSYINGNKKYVSSHEEVIIELKYKLDKEHKHVIYLKKENDGLRAEVIHHKYKPSTGYNEAEEHYNSLL